MNYTELHLVPDYTGCIDRIVKHVLKGSDSDHVVIGPLVHPPLNDNRTSGHDYLTIATSEPGRGFRLDSIVAGRGGGEGVSGKPLRIQLIAAFRANRKLVIHDVGDELDMARLCERLWPGERITRLRKEVEAERASQ
jgi:hypothetical protein